MGDIAKQGKERFTHVWRALGGAESGMGRKRGKQTKFVKGFKGNFVKKQQNNVSRVLNRNFVVFIR